MRASDAAAAASAACLNCGQPFGAPRPHFCPHCGQESNVQPPTLREFAQQFGGAYLSTEGALWRTLRLLLAKPGELTRQYLAGRRKHYVLPLRLYLTISVVSLLLMRVSGGDLLQFKQERPAPANGASAPTVRIERRTPHGTETREHALGDLGIDIGGGRAGMRNGVFFCSGLPNWLCRRLQSRIDVDRSAFIAEMKQTQQRFVANLGSALFVLLPAFALWLKLVYVNRGLRYTEHLVFALHVHAFWFVLLPLVLLDIDWLALIAFVAVPVYTLLALRRVYGGRRWLRWLRALVVTLLYGLTLALTTAGIGLWALLG